MKKQTCAKKHNNAQYSRCGKADHVHSLPRQPETHPCPTEAEECGCNEPIACPPEEPHVVICGKVSFRGQPIHKATVIVVHNRQVIAECITDCDGCYTFKGKVRSYSLRAHKNGRSSRVHTLSQPQKGKHECNLILR